jgi:hypothetical protein
MSTTDSITTAPVEAPKRKRVFMWAFLGIQALFLIWIIAGIASAHNAPDPAAVASVCQNGGWQGLFSSEQDCMVHYANGLQQAGNAGTAIGAGLVIVLWAVTDVILGIGRFIVVTARRGK